MSDLTDRVRDRDRDAAIRTADAALASGRIVQADRDKRVAEIRGARTLQDIAVQLGELAAPTPVPSYVAPTAGLAPSPFADQAGSAPVPSVPYGPPADAEGPSAVVRTAASPAVRRVRVGVVVAVLVSVLVPIVAVVIAVVSNDRSVDAGESTGSAPSDGATYLPGQPAGPDGVNVLSGEGYHELVTAVRTRTGSTTALTAILFPRYAIVETPDPSGAAQGVDYYWDGQSLARADSATSTLESAEPVDLAAIDPQVLVDQLRLLRARVTDPDGWYCVIDHPPGSPAQVTSYARNAAHDASYTVVGLDGTLIYDPAA